MTDSLDVRVARLNNEVLEAAQKVADQTSGLTEQAAAFYKRFEALATENAGSDPELSRLLADVRMDIGYIQNSGKSLTSTRLAQVLRDNAELAARKTPKH